MMVKHTFLKGAIIPALRRPRQEDYQPELQRHPVSKIHTKRGTLIVESRKLLACLPSFLIIIIFETVRVVGVLFLRGCYFFFPLSRETAPTA